MNPQMHLAKEHEVTRVEPEPKHADSLLALIERVVIRPDIDVSKMQQLLELRERFEANEARKAFVAAMKRFKDAPPVITKNKHVHFDTQKGPTDYNHATLDHVCDVVSKALSAVGITHAWKVSQDKEVITVYCVLTHELGHSETTQLMGLPDSSGSKNQIQAIGSTVTYLQRYTLLASCGLAASNDDDGQGGKSRSDPDKIEESCRQMSEVTTLDELKIVFAKAYNEAQSLNDRQAMATLIEAKNVAKARLR